MSRPARIIGALFLLPGLAPLGAHVYARVRKLEVPPMGESIIWAGSGSPCSARSCPTATTSRTRSATTLAALKPFLPRQVGKDGQPLGAGRLSCQR